MGADASFSIPLPQQPIDYCIFLYTIYGAPVHCTAPAPLLDPLLVLPGSLIGLDSGHAKSQVDVPVARRKPAADRRPAVLRAEVPAPAPVHPVRGLRGT